MTIGSTPSAVRLQGSTASYPGLTFLGALACLQRAEEPVLGVVHIEDVQLCPQSAGMLDEECVALLRVAAPRTRFRLHANVRVASEHPRLDATHVGVRSDYFAAVRRVHEMLGSSVYSLHSGRRSGPVSSLDEMFNNVRRLEDAFGTKVAVEGLYPDRARSFFLDDWPSYASLLTTDIHFAIDLSHLKIVAMRAGVIEHALLQELLACERCIEIHVSDNDGFHDQHRVFAAAPWWLPHMESRNSAAVVFTEANHRKRRR